MIRNKKIFCVILARAGSKGIPMKNVKILLGKPLFMWSVEAALQSKYIDIIAISSNCKHCRAIYLDFLKDAKSKGNKKETEVIWIQRPEGYSTDTSKNEEAVIHAIQQINIIKGFIPEISIHLQPTSPCRTNGLLDRCIEEYYNGKYDSLLTGMKITPFMWQRIGGKWVYNVDRNDCCNRKMRQLFRDDLENSEFLFHDCGLVYITETNILLDRKCRIGYNPCVFETKGIENIQIDEEFDFQLIEKMIEVEKLKNLV